MNEQFTNKTDRENEAIAEKLNQVAEQTHPSTQFTAKLEEQFRAAYQPRVDGFATFGQISPTLRWVTLMILLALVLSWSIRNLVPAPQPAINSTPTITTPDGTMTPTPEPVNITSTPGIQQADDDFRGAKLFLQQPLPGSPDSANVYLLKKDEPATLEQARELADRFGIQGDVYTWSALMYGHNDYVFSDGKQLLEVYSNRYFTYTSNIVESRKYPYGIKPSDHAEETIHEFLKKRSLDFVFRLSESDFPGNYILRPLAPDSIPMQYESFTHPAMRVTLDQNGEVLNIDASLMDYESTPVGKYGIISAQEAFQRLLNDNTQTGKMEFVNAPNGIPKEWYRSYPDNQTVTVYGYMTSNSALDPGKPALLLLDGVPVIGNISGLESLEDYSLIKAIGQFTIENGIRRFNVDSWDRKVQQSDLTGTLSRQGDRLILTRDDGTGQQVELLDPPADLPLDTKTPDTQLAVYGVYVDQKMFWTYIQFFDNYSHHGGGGGNGLGFYKINLSGTPVPFPPTAESQPQAAVTNQPVGLYTVQEGDTLSALAQKFGTTVNELKRINNLTDDSIYIGQPLNVPMADLPDRKVESLRGFLSISIHTKSDGTSTREYSLEAPEKTGGTSFTRLDAPNISELDAYTGLPIVVSGTVSGKTGILQVESYQVPYPDLQFQIVKGTQKAEQLAGQNVIVLTTEDGRSYVEALATTNQLNSAFTGQQGDTIQEEILAIPDETFGGLPVAHVYQTAMYQENNPPMEIWANKIATYNDDIDPGSFVQPNLTIDQVELAYYVSDPYYQVNNPDYSQRSPYIQPVWHFHGHYEDGTAFDVLVQALKEEFLQPELAPNITPG